MKEEDMPEESGTVHPDGNAENTDSAWKGLYRTGGVAALLWPYGVGSGPFPILDVTAQWALRRITTKGTEEITYDQA
jgi:hypothetical protein